MSDECALPLYRFRALDVERVSLLNLKSQRARNLSYCFLLETFDSKVPIPNKRNSSLKSKIRVEDSCCPRGNLSGRALITKTNTRNDSEDNANCQVGTKWQQLTLIFIDFAHNRSRSQSSLNESCLSNEFDSFNLKGVESGDKTEAKN